jgi:hypothetical protein
MRPIAVWKIKQLLFGASFALLLVSVAGCEKLGLGANASACQDLAAAVNRDVALGTVQYHDGRNPQVHLTQIQINLELMKANSCPQKFSPVALGADYYQGAVLECSLALIEAETGRPGTDAAVKSKCNAADWKRK